jgi:hypothetical protein
MDADRIPLRSQPTVKGLVSRLDHPDPYARQVCCVAIRKAQVRTGRLQSGSCRSLSACCLAQTCCRVARTSACTRRSRGPRERRFQPEVTSGCRTEARNEHRLARDCRWDLSRLAELRCVRRWGAGRADCGADRRAVDQWRASGHRLLMRETVESVCTNGQLPISGAISIRASALLPGRVAAFGRS